MSREVGFFSGINMNNEGMPFSNFKIACGSKHESQKNFYKIIELIFVHKKLAKAILNEHWLLHGLQWPILTLIRVGGGRALGSPPAGIRPPFLNGQR